MNLFMVIIFLSNIVVLAIYFFLTIVSVQPGGEGDRGIGFSP